MRRPRGFFALVLLAMLGAALISGPATARDESVTFVRIVRVTQHPYQPVTFRVWVKAPVGHQVWVGVKIFDAAGNGVYSGKPSTATFTQPYYSTSLNVTWNKVAYDGSRLPRGQRFWVVAYAADFTTKQSPPRPSSKYAFTLTT